MRACDQTTGCTCRDQQAQHEQPHRVNRSCQKGGLGVPMRMLDSRGPIRQPDSEQGDRDSRGIGEVVDTFGEHSERMRGQPDCDQGADEKQAQDKNDA